MPATILDTRGTFDPMPVLKARREIDRLDTGAELHVLTDDPAAEVDFQAFCQATGNSLVRVTETADGARCIVLRRS